MEFEPQLTLVFARRCFYAAFAMIITLKDLSARIAASLLGDGAVEVSGIASLDSATARDLVFVENEKHLGRALSSAAAAVIVGEFAAGSKSPKPLLIVRQPRLAFARAAAVIHPPRRREPGVHSTAVVHDGAQLGEAVSIEPHAFVAEGARLGNRTHIGPGSFIGPGVCLGADCYIKANVSIYPGVTLGDRVTVHAGAVLGSEGFGYVRDESTGRYEKFPQMGTLEVGDDVEIGANATIDRGALDATVIGAGTKIDNLVHVAHNVRIGRDVVIAAQTGISGSAVIEDGVIVAGQVGIADHVRIERGAILGAQCGVPTAKVIRGAGTLFWGTPARPIRQYLKELAALARLAKKE